MARPPEAARSRARADGNSPERKALTDRLNELEARTWLGGMLPHRLNG